MKNRAMGDILLLLVGTVLLLYSAFRSISILSRTLPADAQVVAYAGLAGLDGGLVAWSLYIITGAARGAAQRAVAYLMIVLQLAGVALTSVGDAVTTADPTGAPAMIHTAVIWGVPVIIFANIAAITITHLANPRRAIEQAEDELEDAIDAEVARRMKERAKQTAGEVVPAAADAREREVLARYGKQHKPTADDDALPLAAGSPNGTGRKRGTGGGAVNP